MALKKKPVTGMKDILPREMELRQYVLSEIRRTYKEFGFTEIETPVVEHIENLLSKQGGDNEKLIFKVQKRGDKLESAFQSGDLDALADSGLRYDLTLPLSRFYSQNQAQLPSPFKALQIGPRCSSLPLPSYPPSPLPFLPSRHPRSFRRAAR